MTQSENLLSNTASQSAVVSSRVFVAEDEYLLAMMLGDDLRDNGFTVVGPFTRLEDACAAAAVETFDIALLDINMNGQLAYSVAETLIARGIPFIFLSGYGKTALPEHLQNARCVPKPYEPSFLISEVRRLTATPN